MPKDCITRMWLVRILRLSILRPLVPPVHFDVVLIRSAITHRGISMIRAEHLLGLAHAGLAVTVSRAVAVVLFRTRCLCAGFLLGRRRSRYARLLSPALGLLDFLELLPVMWGEWSAGYPMQAKLGRREGRGKDACVCLGV